MQTDPVILQRLNDVSRLAAFNNWLGLEVVSATSGEVRLRLPWREELGQYNGYLHAGIIGALIDTACGFAAATLSERLLASQYAVRCLRPAVADTFIVSAKVVKPGRQQIFAAAQISALDAPNRLLAVGDAILVPINEP
ncbi:phenylacetic acid degradation protein [Pseudomonas sp. WN033]|nr:phenylacetic acid degradation protein [Pseudomonas sp. WN033]